MSYQLGPSYYGPAPDDWPESVAGPHLIDRDDQGALAAGGPGTWDYGAPGPNEPGTWTDPADTEQRWGFGGMGEPTCRHGVTGSCVACETECVHGNYGPGCPTCREVYG
jgi:hypothetical protein